LIQRAILAAALLASPLSAQLFVSPTGSSTSNCTSAAPCTIARADVVATPGVTINVAPGNYTGGIVTHTAGTANSRIVWLSTTKWGAKLVGVGSQFGVWAVWGSFVDINGFDMTTNGSFGTCLGIIGLQQTPSPAVGVHIIGNNCHDIENNPATSGTCVPTGAFSDGTGGSDDWFIGNVIRHAGWPDPTTGSHCIDVHGIYTTGVRQVLENNVISGVSGWGIQMRNSGDLTSGYCCNVISGNTIFNNNGGIVIDETGNTARAVLDFVTMSNNVVVNNGPGSGLGGSGTWGVNYFHLTGKNWVVNNNLIYGNKGPGGIAGDQAHHGQLCGQNASGGTPVVGVAITGTDGNGDAGGCPQNLPRTDSGGATATFINFQTDTNTAPAASYDVNNYKLNGSTPTRAIQGGASPTSCAIPPGLTPCAPPVDFAGTVRTLPYDIGAWAFTSGGVPIVNFSPSPLNFGTIPVSTSQALTATLANTGAAVLNITASTIAGTNQADYKITSKTCGATLGAGSNCTFLITFTPSAAGVRSASLTLTTNAAGSPQQLPLTGTGGTVGVTFNPTSLTFGVTAPGSCSANQTYTVSSTGTTALALNGATFTGANSGEFAFGGTGTCNQPGSVPPGGSCTISIKFCPASGGSKSATVSQSTNAPGSPQLEPLSGTGGTSTATLLPATFAYGNVQVGTSLSHNFVFTNTGTLTLTGISVSITGATGSYTQTNNCPASLAPAGNCTIAAVFKPATGGLLNASLNVASSAVPSPTTAALSGTGTVPATISLSPASVPFVDTLVGNFSAVTNVVATNTGASTVNISGVSVVGTNPGDFTAGECASTFTGFTDNFNTGTLSSSWQKDSGTAPQNGATNVASFSTANVDLTNGMLGLKLTQSIVGGVATSVGAEVRSTTAFGFGTYRWSTRMGSTATSPLTTGTVPTGQVSSNFILNSSTANPYTEIDSPEVTGNQPNLAQWTTWTTTSLNTSTSTAIANPELAFHLYQFKWTASSAAFSIDGTPASTITTNIPTANGNPMMNLWGTNNAGFGGAATVGTRWMFVKAFSFSPAGVSSLAPGASCAIPVYFSPQSTGTKSAILSVADSASGSPHQASLSGNGTAASPSLSPTSHDYGNQPVGSATTPFNFQWSNTGTGPMPWSVSLTGANPADFILGANSIPNPLPAGQSGLLPVSFKPTTSGARAATLNLATGAGGAATAGPCNLNATTATFAAQLAAATPGQVLCLATGNYGSFAGVAKASPGVTIAAQSGATPTMFIAIHQLVPVAAFLTFDGITFSGGDLSGPAHDLTFRNSRFSDKLNVYAGANNNACSNCPAMNNNNIVFDNDLFDMSANQSGAGGFEGRFNILGNTLPAGVTVRNSKFTTGCADGIQSVGGGGNGYTIGPGNEFFNLKQGSCGPHVDSIQFVGSSSPGPVITGNYFHDDSDGIVAFDNANSATITSNVIANVDQFAILLAGFDSVSVVSNNTVPNGDIFCGYTHQGNACQAQIRNNITGDFNQGGTTIAGSTGTNPSFFDYNLCTSSCAIPGALPTPISAGAHSLSGTATFVGGASPTTYAGYLLTSGSIGHNAGSDGKDMGIAPNQGGTLSTASLTGTGVVTAPAVCLSTTSVDFGNQPVNSTSNATPIVVTNCGTAALTSVVVTPTGNFTQTNDFSVSVAVGGHFTIQGKFAPLSAGALTGNFSIASNAASSPNVVSLKGFGTQSGATISPGSISFGHITVGQQSSPTQVTVTNTSNITLPVSATTITGTGATQFVSGSCPANLAAGGSCQYSVVFAPQGALAFTATLNQAFGNGVATQTIPLSGTGDAPVPTLSLTPSSLDYGNVQQGTPSQVKTITLLNTSLTSLTLTSVLPTGANAADVAVTSHCGATPVTIAAGTQCTVDVTVTPSTTSAETAAVTFTSNAASSPDSVGITVTGTAVPVPRVLLSPSSLSFSPPSIQTTTVSAAQDVVANNIGNANLLVSNVALAGANQADFSLTTNCGTVTPGSNCKATVNCTPLLGHIGSLTASVVFTDNAAGSPRSAALTCTAFDGQPIITLGISKIDFGNQTVGTTSNPLTFIVSNTGQATASGLAITTSGDFAVSGACGATLAAGANCSEQVTFTPLILCGQFDPNNPATCISNVHLGQISVVSNTSNSPQIITLQGTAVPVPPPPGPVKVTMGGVLHLGGHLVAGVQ
jgi:hypothetical protein